jgi:isoquinoline 1-oxidoreductase beta subunit
MVKVHRVVVAIDTGYAVNPALIERQIGGSVAWNLSGLFHEEITFKDGRAEQSNYDDYVCLKLSQMPQVDVTILEGGGDTWGGAGEPAALLVAPAVVNALFRASGQRIRSAPLKNLGYALA